MDSVFGFTGEGYALVVADTTSARSILAYKHDEDKLRELDASKVAACAGPQADCANFMEYIKANMALYEYRTGLKHSMKTASSYMRTELATALRKNPYQVNLLLAGFDEGLGASLYFLDYLGTSHQVNYAAHGYAASFVSSTMDDSWRPGMTEEAGVALAKKCILELRTRFLISHPSFLAKIITKDGIRIISVDGPAVAT